MRKAHIMKTKLSLLGILSLFIQPVWAADMSSINLLTQSEFKLLSEDLGAALSYKPVTPAEPLGLFGFDLGVEASSTTLANPAVLKKATTNGFTSDSLVLPKLHFLLGLPLKFDVGVFYSAVPDSNIQLYGGELRYAIIEGGTATPAVAIRGSMSKMTGVDQLSFSTKALDVSISKGFAMFTPYAGIGEVWSDSTPNGIPTLTKESISQTKYFVGGNLNFLFMNLDLEYDKTGSDQTYSLKLGFRF
jgi:hypothetical protein